MAMSVHAAARDDQNAEVLCNAHGAVIATPVAVCLLEGAASLDRTPPTTASEEQEQQWGACLCKAAPRLASLPPARPPLGLGGCPHQVPPCPCGFSHRLSQGVKLGHLSAPSDRISSKWLGVSMFNLVMTFYFPPPKKKSLERAGAQMPPGPRREGGLFPGASWIVGYSPPRRRAFLQRKAPPPDRNAADSRGRVAEGSLGRSARNSAQSLHMDLAELVWLFLVLASKTSLVVQSSAKQVPLGRGEREKSVGSGLICLLAD